MSDLGPLDSPLGRHGLSQIVYGAGVSLDDPAEAYHEASKLSGGRSARPSAGAALLEQRSDLRAVAERSAKRYPHRPVRELPAPARLAATLQDTLARRVSVVPCPVGAALELRAVSTLLHAACGGNGRPHRRTVPSAGALYPLELYVVSRDVPGLEPAVHHYDPLSHRLEELWPVPEETLSIFADPAPAQAPLLVFVTAMLWRTRFKYGLRGYRFALLEAGHLMQNLVLAAAALELAAIPIGGFYDRRVEAVLRIDGVNEVALYCAAVGAAEPAR